MILQCRGHTWQDLKDSALSISWPFNVLRCLHIWKPKNREWGYDLITSAALRIGNNQLGCEPGDLEQFLDHLERMGFPEFLDGTIDFDSDEAWQVYIRETITNIFTFFLKVNGAALALYFGVTTLMALCMGSVGFAHFHRSVTRVIRAYSLVLGLMLYILYSVNSSSWAVDISSGKTLMRPFPPVESFWLEDPAVSKGPTQLPHSRDVLIGTRLNARTIGAYSSWMDFHPGNRDFLDYVSQYGGQLYRSYKQGLPSAFHQFLITNAIEEIRKKQGNFLQQDYRTGEWRGMTSSEIEDYVTLQLLLGRESLLAALKQEIDYLLDDCRFGFLFRTTTMSMSRVSQTHLQHLEKQFFGMPTSTSVYSKLPSQSFLTPKTFLPGMSTRKEDNRRVRAVFFPEEEPPAFFPNELVSLQSRDEDLIRATVVGLSKDDKYDIAFLGDFADYSAGKRRLPRSILSKTLPVMEGAPVHANYMQRGEWFRGRILRVGPSGHIDILFDDGDFEETVSSDFYSTATEWYKFE